MNTNLTPTYQKLFGEYWVLWYAKSNSYSVVDSKFKTLLDYYFRSESENDFITKLAINDEAIESKNILNTIKEYLKGCHETRPLTNDFNCALDTNNRNILKQYKVKGKEIQVYYDSELVLKTIHPSIAHLVSKIQSDVKVCFDIYLKNEELNLFKNGQLISRVPKRDYHHIQGKFIMQLLCAIHGKEETDWIGTLHGSTITDNNSSILFVGNSGSGKSTLCALLVANGFDLLADDVSPLLSEEKHIYYNPSAVSIKKGAFNVLRPVIDSFETFPITEFNTTKGAIRYIPFSSPEKNHYPCNKIVLVNYKDDAKTSLENIPIKLFLETLIPDSWLSPDPKYAKQFIDWLGTLSMYILTYSDSKSAVKEISELFDQTPKG